MAPAEPTSGTFWSTLKRWADAEFLRAHEDKVLLFLTLIIGAVVGLVVVAFILLTENLGSRMYPAGGAAWRRLVIPVVGSLVTGFLLSKYFPNARGSGIPQTKTALFVQGGVIKFRTVLGKFFCSSVSLASGIALGREGPSVQVGAGLASSLGRRLGLSPNRVRDLVPIGAAAALAAAFNTPIAAVLFTLEEVMGDLHAPVLGSIVLSSATSWMVLHLLLGDEPLFHVPSYQLVHPLEFALYAVLGLAGGLVSVLFVKLLLWQRKQFLRLPVRTRWIQPVAGGLLVGVLGWFIPEVLGVGYSYVSQTLNGQIVLSMMLMLVFLKVIATATCYSSGNAGGIFGPSLFIGAMLGGATGGFAHTLLPDYTGSVGAYALVGMGTAFAGIIRVPLTSVIMIFEITRDYSIIVPLMISNLISYFISSRLQPEPIYEALQHQDGIHLPPGARDRDELLQVRDGMHQPAETLSADELVAVAAARVHRGQEMWPVMDSTGLRGLVSIQQLDDAMDDGRGWQPVADLLLTSEIVHIHADDSLDTAMRRMALSGVAMLPVVNRANARQLEGVISLHDILAAYGLEKGATRPRALARTEAKTPVGTLGGIVAAAVLAVVLIGVLSYVYRVERAARAKQYLEQATGLLARERYEEAIEKYRNALSITHSAEQRLALAEALRQAGRLDEAELYFNEVLRQNPRNAAAHMGLARIAAARKDLAQMVAEYHRGMEYNPGARIAIAFELVDALGKSGQTKQAQSELLALMQPLPPGPARKQLGHLLLQYGLASESAEVFREALADQNQDADAYAGLGEADLALEDLLDASAAYRQAVRLNPASETALQRLHLVEQIIALDPALSGLSSAERYRRSRKLMESALGALDQCLAAKPGAPPADLRTLTDQARRVLLSHSQPHSYADASESNIALAAQLWQQRLKLCGQPSPAEEALSRAMALAAR